MEPALKWTERASAEVEAIVRYIARRNPEAATRIGMGIYERAQELMRQPELGSPEVSLLERRWRKLVYRRWKTIYTIVDEVIIVGRVWPCALGDVDFTKPLEDES